MNEKNRGAIFTDELTSDKEIAGDRASSNSQGKTRTSR